MGVVNTTPEDIIAGVNSTGPPPAQPGQRTVIWTLWLTYGAFYFCRTNLSAAVPGLKAAAADGGMGLSGDQVGWILASLKIAYGVGQLLNGQLSERFSPRVMLAIGMFGSAALNVVFGLSTGFYFLLFVWATNGFCQSLGWTPCVRVIANWVPIEHRGNAIGIIGTGYQVTLGLTYIVATTAVEWFGWRGAVHVPAVLLATTGLFMLVCLREKPAPDSDSLHNSARSTSSPSAQLPFSEVLYWTLYNPTLWLLGLSLGLLNACRYGYLDWGLTHLVETRNLIEGQKMPIGKAGLQYCVIAVGATLGSYLAGWATDRFFGSRRAPVICILLAALGILSFFYNSTVQYSVWGAMFVLVMIGFCIYGPQVLLVGTAPADLAHRGTSAAAAGFVNFMGYMGAAIGDVVTGYFSAEAHGGWTVAIRIWAGWAFAGAVISAALWNTTSRKIGVLPGVFPKTVALAALVAASASISLGEQPVALRAVTYLAVLVVSGAFVNRWAAVPAWIVSMMGLLTVFVRYIQSRQGVTWDETTAMAAYGLAMIATSMIFVERKAEECASS